MSVTVFLLCYSHTNINMKYRAIIFDLDGTLLNTIEDLKDSVNTVLKQYGFPEHTLNAYRYFIGEGVEQLMFRSLPPDKRTDSMIRTGVKDILKEYNNRWHNKTRPFPGILQLLASLKKIKTAVLSNKPQEFTRKSVDYFFPDVKFDIVMGARKGIPNKPDPYGAKLIASKFSLKSSEVAYLGDSDIDMKCAKSADMNAFGVLWGFRDEKELKENGADVLLKSPMELLDYL